MAPTSPETEPRPSEEVEPPQAEADTGTRALWVPLYLYLGGVLVYGLSEVAGHLEKRLPDHTAWLFVPAVLYLAVGSLASGRVPLRGEAIRRGDRPRVFWTVVSIYFLVAGVLALIGFGLFSG